MKETWSHKKPCRTWREKSRSWKPFGPVEVGRYRWRPLTHVDLEDMIGVPFPVSEVA